MGLKWRAELLNNLDQVFRQCIGLSVFKIFSTLSFCVFEWKSVLLFLLHGHVS